MVSRPKEHPLSGVLFFGLTAVFLLGAAVAVPEALAAEPAPAAPREQRVEDWLANYHGGIWAWSPEWLADWLRRSGATVEISDAPGDAGKILRHRGLPLRAYGVAADEGSVLFVRGRAVSWTWASPRGDAPLTAGPSLVDKGAAPVTAVWAENAQSLTWTPWPAAEDYSRRVVAGPERGDRVVAGLPQVDQALPGYCAPAALECLLRHYGIPLDAETLAGLGETRTDSGTNVQRLLDRLRGRLGALALRTHLGFDYARFERLAKAYNESAAHAGKKPVPWTPPVVDLGATFQGTDPALMRAAAMEQPGFRAFRRSIRDSIEAGHPLVWGVVLGIVPETGIGPRTRGGHLRLIVGYSRRTGEILYADMWGDGHACKRMTAEDAWTITMSLHSFAVRK